MTPIKLQHLPQSSKLVCFVNVIHFFPTLLYIYKPFPQILDLGASYKHHGLLNAMLITIVKSFTVYVSGLPLIGWKGVILVRGTGAG